MSDLSTVFKIVNITVGALTAISGVAQLVSGIQEFFLGIYLVLFGAGIILLEFRIPPATYQYASFLFSFAGRGIFYFLIGVIGANHQPIKIVFGVLVSLVGIAYSALEFVPSIEPPENFKPQATMLEENDEDVI